MIRSRTHREFSRRHRASAPVAALLVVAAASAAAGSPTVRRATAHVTGGSIHLSPVHSFEITGTPAQPGIEVQGRPTGQLPVMLRSWIVRRDLPELWSTSLDAGESAADLDVSLQIIGEDGRVGVLSQGEQASGEVRARAIPLPPQESLERDGSHRVSGGGVLVLDLADVRRAGRYRGTLVITIDRF